MEVNLELEEESSWNKGKGDDNIDSHLGGNEEK